MRVPTTNELQQTCFRFFNEHTRNFEQGDVHHRELAELLSYRISKLLDDDVVDNASLESAHNKKEFLFKCVLIGIAAGVVLTMLIVAAIADAN